MILARFVFFKPGDILVANANNYTKTYIYIYIL